MGVMRRVHHGIVSYLVLVGYLSATVVVSSSHDHHDHAECCRTAVRTGNDASSESSPKTQCCHHGHRHGDAGTDDSHAGRCRTDGRDETGSGERPDHAPLHDDDCSACRFLAVKSLAVAPAAIVAYSDLVAEFRPAVVFAPASEPLGLPNSRAPPRLG